MYFHSKKSLYRYAFIESRHTDAGFVDYARVTAGH